MDKHLKNNCHVPDTALNSFWGYKRLKKIQHQLNNLKEKLSLKQHSNFWICHYVVSLLKPIDFWYAL